MEKVFKNKKLAYVLIGILCALQLTQSIANWCGGGFNGGSLILCILMLGLLVLVGVGITKNNKLLTIVSSVSILSVLIYVLASSYSGMIQNWIDGKIPLAGLITNIFGSIGTLLLIGTFVLFILRTFKMARKLETVNIVLSLVATLMFLVVLIIPVATKSTTETTQKVCLIARDLGAIFFALLIPCIWHQVDTKE